jgi:hypothetical protein
VDCLAVVGLGFVAWRRMGSSVLGIVRERRKSVLRWCGRRRCEGRARLERDRNRVVILEAGKRVGRGGGLALCVFENGFWHII